LLSSAVSILGVGIAVEVRVGSLVGKQLVAALSWGFIRLDESPEPTRVKVL
jgi:hypothetical protein